MCNFFFKFFVAHLSSLCNGRCVCVERSHSIILKRHSFFPFSLSFQEIFHPIAMDRKTGDERNGNQKSKSTSIHTICMILFSAFSHFLSSARLELFSIFGLLINWCIDCDRACFIVRTLYTVQCLLLSIFASIKRRSMASFNQFRNRLIGWWHGESHNYFCNYMITWFFPTFSYQMWFLTNTNEKPIFILWTIF